jgi:hypothetical protein
LACFWYGKKGFTYSVVITVLHLLLFILYNSEPIWEALTQLLEFITIGLIVYKLADNIKGHELKISNLNKKLKSDIVRFNKSEMLSQLGNYEIDLKTGKVVWSDELFRIFGFEPGSFEPTRQKRIELTYHSDKQLVKDSIDKAINGEGSFKIESRIIRTDGSMRWVLSTGYIGYNFKRL